LLDGSLLRLLGCLLPVVNRHDHERCQNPDVLFESLCDRTDKIGFTTRVLILAQRQAVLARSRPHCSLNLSGERLPLVIGLGWNDVELPDRPDTPVGATQ